MGKYTNLDLPLNISDSEISSVYEILQRLKINPHDIRKMPFKEYSGYAGRLYFKYPEFSKFPNAELILTQIISNIYNSSMKTRTNKLTDVPKIVEQVVNKFLKEETYERLGPGGWRVDIDTVRAYAQNAVEKSSKLDRGVSSDGKGNLYIEYRDERGSEHSTFLNIGFTRKGGIDWIWVTNDVYTDDDDMAPYSKTSNWKEMIDKFCADPDHYSVAFTG